MPELIRILSACEMVEVKLRVLKSVTCIIDQVGDKVGAFMYLGYSINAYTGYTLWTSLA